MYGHIAARLRQAMAARDLNVQDVNRAMGIRPENSGLYVMLASKVAPGNVMRARLSKVLKIPEADLMAREDSGGLVAMQRSAPVARVPREESSGGRDVLTFAINSEGAARIKCDVTLPAIKGAALLQILLNAGLAIGGDDGS
jgi:hypothetical protein